VERDRGATWGWAERAEGRWKTADGQGEGLAVPSGWDQRRHGPQVVVRADVGVNGVSVG